MQLSSFSIACGYGRQTCFKVIFGSNAAILTNCGPDLLRTTPFKLHYWCLVLSFINIFCSSADNDDDDDDEIVANNITGEKSHRDESPVRKCLSYCFQPYKTI